MKFKIESQPRNKMMQKTKSGFLLELEWA